MNKPMSPNVYRVTMRRRQSRVEKRRRFDSAVHIGSAFELGKPPSGFIPDLPRVSVQILEINQPAKITP